tara:strand:- start:575 stop:1636 length:1062 start_codon:yes stop_codon:yes gene_type:complete
MTRSRHTGTQRRQSKRQSPQSRTKVVKQPPAVVTDPDEFLAEQRSKGFHEHVPASTEFKSHDASDLDVKFLLALLKKKHRISRHVVIPVWLLCLYEDSTAMYTNGARCPAMVSSKSKKRDTIRAGILFTHLDTARPRLIAPSDFETYLSRLSKRFVVINVGIYGDSWKGLGHANVLIVDVHQKTIDRYEPAGSAKDRYDASISRLLKSRLPSFRYLRYVEHAAGEQRASTDSYDGMCVTFSLLYVLYRLLNPDAQSTAIRRYMASLSDTKLKRQSLQLNRFVADTLRGFGEGALVRKRIQLKRKQHQLLKWRGKDLPEDAEAVGFTLRPQPHLRRGATNGHDLVLVQDRVCHV